MKDRLKLFYSSIGRKLIMALTGLFLCLFLVGHLLGNLQLFIPGEAGRVQFNEYALFMTSNPAVKLLSYFTYISILFHAIEGLYLAYRNKKARPVKYVGGSSAKHSFWSSRNMGVLGTLVLVFIVLHMVNFWAKYHWGDLGVDSAGNRDLYSLVVLMFKQWWYVVIYVLSMIAIAFHLVHGFQSGFQTLGLSHPSYTPLIKTFSLGFGIIVPLLFAMIPIDVFLGNPVYKLIGGL